MIVWLIDDTVLANVTSESCEQAQQGSLTSYSRIKEEMVLIIKSVWVSKVQSISRVNLDEF
jgi:hypothetical protein